MRLLTYSKGQVLGFLQRTPHTRKKIMNPIKQLSIGIVVCIFLVWFGQLLCFADNPNSFSFEGIIVCGDDKVLIIDEKNSNGKNIKIVWQWQTSESRSQLPEVYQRYLRTIDECKSVDNNTKLLITASSGGVLLLDRQTKKCLFYAHSPMAHSADLLPDHKIAVALSTNPQGNSIELYDVRQPEKVLFKDSLHSGHGAVWVAKQNRFYALGFDELREYSLKNGNTKSPTLHHEKTWNIPVKSGHDLFYASPKELLISGHEGVVVFDIEQEQFSPFKPLQSTPNVKSVNYNVQTNQLHYTKAEESWWTHNIYLENPHKTLTIPNMKIYKVRTINW
jgi:hypothetical protein